MLYGSRDSWDIPWLIQLPHVDGEGNRSCAAKGIGMKTDFVSHHYWDDGPRVSWRRGGN